MKTRSGFVSNSSSCSFCIVLPKEIISQQELFELLEPLVEDKSKKYTVDHYDYEDTEEFTLFDLCQIIKDWVLGSHIVIDPTHCVYYGHFYTEDFPYVIDGKNNDNILDFFLNIIAGTYLHSID